MRILFMNSIQMFGGGEVWMLRTLQALQQRGHHVWLCCRPGMEVGRRAAETGIPVKLISFRGDFDPITIFHLAWWMKRERIEVVLTNMDKELRLGGIAARIATVPAIIPRRGIDYPLKNRWQYRFAYNTLATIIIANSNATRKALLRHAPWLDPERIEVIYNGVDVQPFLQLSHDTPHNNQNKKFRNLRHEWGIQEKAPLLGFVGQLDKRKGIDVLLSAFHIIRRQVPEARLVLVGRGPLQEMVKNEARNLGWYTPEGDNAVLLPGFIDDVVGVMRAIDVLLLPSFWEGFGIVLIEAMAASKPVISTNTSSMPEIVVDGHTGYLVSPGDTEALASRTIELLQNSVLRERFGRAGCQRAIEYFTLERMIDNLENLFRRQIRERRGFD
jgi:glycosyltransferase involved in cell wall biosynthesis